MWSTSGGRLCRQACRANCYDGNTLPRLYLKFRKQGRKLRLRRFRRLLLRVILTAIRYFLWFVPDPESGSRNSRKASERHQDCVTKRDSRFSHGNMPTAIDYGVFVLDLPVFRLYALAEPLTNLSHCFSGSLNLSCCGAPHFSLAWISTDNRSPKNPPVFQILGRSSI
jgi:hypothetical protein